jgi:hypothetical protein
VPARRDAGARQGALQAHRPLGRRARGARCGAEVRAGAGRARGARRAVRRLGARAAAGRGARAGGGGARRLAGRALLRLRSRGLPGSAALRSRRPTFLAPTRGLAAALRAAPGQGTRTWLVGVARRTRGARRQRAEPHRRRCWALLGVVAGARTATSAARTARPIVGGAHSGRGSARNATANSSARGSSSRCAGELLEEGRRRAVEERAPEPLAPTDHVDQPALEQRLEHAAHGHAADLLDLRAPDRLAVGDDGERLERRGVSRCGRWAELGALDGLGVLGARQQLPPPPCSTSSKAWPRRRVS